MPDYSNFFRRALLASALTIVSVPGAAQDLRKIQFEIPATTLDAALQAVGRQSGREIMYSSEVVAGRRAPRLVERLTPDEAIRRLLDGSGLIADFRPDVVLIRGRSLPSDAGAAPAVDATEGEVIVTGTRTKGGGGISRVQVVGRQRAEEEGFSELGSLARSLTENFTGGQNPGVISAQKGSENVAGSTALNLRGLGADATLTLVNGHRVANESAGQGTDISAVPLIAVERLELLPDGSSALYGSDAVGGVANIILRQPFAGAEARAHLAVPTRGGGLQDQYSMIAGSIWSGGGLVAALDYLHADPINADERSFTRSLDPSATLVPTQRQYSGVLGIQQDVGNRAQLTIDGGFNRRTIAVALPTFSPGDVRTNGVLSSRGVQSFNIAPSLNFTPNNDWDFRLSGVHSENRVRSHLFSYSQGREAARVLTIYKHRLDSAEIGGEGPLFALPGGSARLAIGGGWRRAAFDGDINAVIGGVPRTTLNVHNGYDVGFAYAETSLPLVGQANARPGLLRFRLNGAVRYEHYSKIGGVAVPKFGILYEPLPGLALRGSWGKSFKAPTLLQNGSVMQGFLTPSRIYAPAPAAGGTVILLGGGGNPLEPERAQTWTAGAVFTPFATRDVRMEATYFNVHFRDRVLKPISTDTLAFSSPNYAGLITLNPSAAQVASLVAALPQGLTNQTGAPVNLASVTAIVDNRLRNVARQNAQGVDVTVHVGAELSTTDRLSVDGSLSYLKSDQQLIAGQPSIQRAGTIFDPPHWRGRGSIGWRRAQFALTGSANYIGGTTDNRFTPTQRVGSFLSFDMIATLRPTTSADPLAGASITLAALNLFDKAPDLIRNTNPAAPPFDSTNYPSTGRVLSVTIAKRW